MRRRGLRWWQPLTVLTVLALAGCMSRGEKPDGLTEALIYAPPGTAIETLNTVDGVESRARIVASPPHGLEGRAVRDDGVSTSFFPGCWDCGAPARIPVEKYLRLWPLETGKATRFERVAPDGQVTVMQIRVAGAEEIRTPAGRFRTWRLEGFIEAKTGPRWSARVTAWWAPEPGWVVRAEAEESTGRRRSSVVTDIRLPGRWLGG